MMTCWNKKTACVGGLACKNNILAHKEPTNLVVIAFLCLLCDCCQIHENIPFFRYTPIA
jgi:hypothetical protein